MHSPRPGNPRAPSHYPEPFSAASHHLAEQLSATEYRTEFLSAKIQ